MTNYHRCVGLKLLTFFTVLAARSPESRLVLFGGSDVELSMTFSQFLMVADNLWHSLACGNITLVSASAFTWHFLLCVMSSPLLKRMTVIWFRATPMLHNSISTDYISETSPTKISSWIFESTWIFEGMLSSELKSLFATNFKVGIEGLFLYWLILNKQVWE